MKVQEITLTSKLGRPFGIDIRSGSEDSSQPIILYVHGFKGFKDAMHQNEIATNIASKGFAFVKMNLSHNGVTPEHPIDFVDLEAFGQNNFTKESDDIETVIDFILSSDFPLKCDKNKLYLIGHSRGGGISLIKTADDRRIKKLVTWASVADFVWRWDQNALDYWRSEGTIYVENSRTNQQMPLHYQIVEDFYKQGDRYIIDKRVKEIHVPTLCIHGTKDETVPLDHQDQLKSSNPTFKTAVIEGAAHTFGGVTPWTDRELPDHTKQLIQITVDFLHG
ncbi:alpha/beta hydrolase family protein [Reichenbachiella versicolor]|uniref:alpha/beta hydrolase family protein n=1 Tax=Reichenbachiella versicolor TaxID=1821036 RepID=UPI000D6E7BCF|nr:prolyl oligopeptidase family serine peptidase [Reichenbachiella versicolor]